jgi:hypothetical protein
VGHLADARSSLACTQIKVATARLEKEYDAQILASLGVSIEEAEAYLRSLAVDEVQEEDRVAKRLEALGWVRGSSLAAVQLCNHPVPADEVIVCDQGRRTRDRTRRLLTWTQRLLTLECVTVSPPAPPDELSDEQRNELKELYLNKIRQLRAARPKPRWWYAGLASNMLKRHHHYRQHKTRASHQTVLSQLHGPYAFDWIQHHEAAAMRAAEELLGPRHAEYGNKRLDGGEGRGRVRKWRESVYLLEEA